jgi:hypothetical protein
MDTPLDAEITPGRLDELIRWHGTDESNLPPAHTLKNLARDTVAALRELQQSRQRIERLRAAMGRAFWADDPRELHAMLLAALGPPPEVTNGGPTGGTSEPAGAAPHGWTANWTAS